MSLKRVLVVGSSGLLGQKVSELLVRGSSGSIFLAGTSEPPQRHLITSEFRSLDITSKKDVKRVVSECEPNVIINAAAMTNVDACERKRELAWKVNVEGLEHLIEAARKHNPTIVHVSSDYIFDGKEGPYSEDDRPNPVNYYGKTKLAGENALRASGLPFLILRAMVLYGYAPAVRPNFALWLIQNLEKRHSVRVVDDQTGNPTFVDDLAFVILRGIELGRSGIYHVAGREIMSRYEFAKKLARVFGFDSSLIIPIKTTQLSQPAKRPLRSGLITLKAEVELGLEPSTADEGLSVLKSQLSRTMRQMADSAPVPSGRSARH